MNDINNQDIIIPIVAGTLVMGLLIAFILIFIFRYQQKQKAFQKEREEFARELLQTKIEIQEQTLSNISRELHDNLGQLASLIKIQLNLLVQDNPSNQQKITDLKELLNDLITEIKSLSTSLKSENLNRFGLLEMIKKDVNRYQTIGGMEIETNISSKPILINQEQSIFIYRMFQEIFNNIVKHADCSNAYLEIASENNSFKMEIKDNGKGFDISSPKKGAGLVNLKERCEMIGAKLNINSKVGEGTKTTITLAIKDE
ncbi:sensor histidine kinase [Paracrocinitomix mangrovi]|uniref:sensor histidine kinase n=1 Tax=Paracrocinitomix mangrovi TaxID=2862509 RepID=UPI001C8D265A|nr:sensor histidine kinase [Paracrocinitomix mangrovi]UKN01086.1 sensor histidine kinase [Paracrocinitomix mangrovi]